MVITDLPKPWELQQMLVPLSIVLCGRLFSFMLSSIAWIPMEWARAGCFNLGFLVYVSCNPRESGEPSDGSCCFLISWYTKKQRNES